MGMAMERFDLPEGWYWRSLGDKDVLSEIKPGFACGKKDIVGGAAQLRMNNISRDGFLDMKLVRRIPISIAEKANKWLDAGDVVFNNTNSTELVGKSLVFPGWSERCTYSNHLTRLRCNTKTITTEWLYFCLRELWLSGFFAANCTEFIGQSAFNKDKLEEIEIPVPPLEEQMRIVERIEEFTKRVEQAKDITRNALTELETFTPALLAKAFKGEL
jgi:type I restriction enzyme, S subunit